MRNIVPRYPSATVVRITGEGTIVDVHAAFAAAHRSEPRPGPNLHELGVEVSVGLIVDALKGVGHALDRRGCDEVEDVVRALLVDGESLREVREVVDYVYRLKDGQDRARRLRPVN